MSTTERTTKICSEISTILANKNADYGESFHLLFLQEGLAASRIRLGDKYNRFCTLTRKNDGERKVKSESIRDTLLDMAGYAILTIAELDRDNNKEVEKKNSSLPETDPSRSFFKLIGGKLESQGGGSGL